MVGNNEDVRRETIRRWTPTMNDDKIVTVYAHANVKRWSNGEGVLKIAHLLDPIMRNNLQ